MTVSTYSAQNFAQLNNMGGWAGAIASTLSLSTQKQQHDPIQAEIIQTNNPALEVYDLFESGKAAEFWNKQLKHPSATWLGRCIDWLFGIGEYSNLAEKTDAIARKTLDNNCKIDICNDPRLALPIEFNFSIGLDAAIRNNSCTSINPIHYLGEFYNGDTQCDEHVCGLEQCVFKVLSACNNNCLPCISAQGDDRVLKINATEYMSPFVTKQISTHWLLNIKAAEDINKWKLSLINNLILKILQQCEDEQLAAMYAKQWVIFSAIAIPTTAIAIGLFFLHRCIRINPEQFPLNTPIGNGGLMRKSLGD